MLSLLGGHVSTDIVAAGTAVVTGLGGLGGYLLKRQERSGTIATSPAEALWAEGAEMRKELREDAEALRTEVLGMRTEMLELRQQAMAHEQESIRLQRRLEECHAELVVLRAQFPPKR